jgi:hypothetical protein
MSAHAAILWLALAFTSVVQGTPATPDFSGRWQLNVADTEFPGARPSAGDVQRRPHG